MEKPNVSSVDNVTLVRRGYFISGTIVLSPHHLVFSFNPNKEKPDSSATLREIWICYPVIDRISKSRGSSLINNSGSSNGNGAGNVTGKYPDDDFDHYSASNIRIQCKDFTYYSFDFVNDLICTEVYRKLSSLITAPKVSNNIRDLYAFSYKANMLEQQLESKGWDLYDPIKEYIRQDLIPQDFDVNNEFSDSFWRLTTINEDYRFCASYPKYLIVPSSISDNVLKHAGKFRSKQRIPAIVYKHRSGINGNVIARCAQPLVGLNIQNRSIQDEKLIAEIFESQKNERIGKLSAETEFREQPQKNLIVDLRPITNAMAQHALGAGTEHIDFYRGLKPPSENHHPHQFHNQSHQKHKKTYHVDKIFGNIDNIHVVRDSLNKLNTILNDLDKFPVPTDASKSSPYPLLQQSLTKTQWLHRLSIVLQSVDRITKSIHLNNTNVIIHCSDGWDRTSQVSALAQLCLDPYYRTIEGFMVLIEKEWVSFGFKFATRGDHGGCIGAAIQKQALPHQLANPANQSLERPALATENGWEDTSKVASSSGVSLFLQKAARAANHIKTTAQSAAAASTSSLPDLDGEGSPFSSVYTGSNEKSPVFHQFLDCVYQICRQHPQQFEFNSRFLKRLFYHYYSCQYGSFLCDSERELREVHKIQNATVSVWDYFNSRPNEFKNNNYEGYNQSNDQDVLFFNFTDVKWWYELYGRSDEEMNGLSNSLDRKFAQMKLNQNATNMQATSSSASAPV